MGDLTARRERFERRIAASARAIAGLAEQIDAVTSAAGAVVRCLHGGGTLYTCGNGGSAAEAMHLSEELIGRYVKGDRPAQRAICLNADPAALTCIANDFGFENVFARQCEALLGPGDALAVLSTSGESENLVNALRVARARRATTIGLLGRGGGAAAALCDHAVVIDDRDSARIQEAHLVVVHLLCEAVEHP